MSIIKRRKYFQKKSGGDKMSQWQVLRAGRVSRAALGSVHHGPVISVHSSTATTTSAAPESSRMFCLSKQKLTMHHLNRRLALYLEQVLCLQMANQRLEHQIKDLLNRMCPRELKEIDGHLRTASVLQDQISECLTAQAHMKMQLMDAELNIFNFNARCGKEREYREHLEKELSNLRWQEEELKANKLPELQSLLNSQTQQLAELQIQHQQGLLAQVLGGISLEVQTAESSDLVQQLDELRPFNTTLLNRIENKCWLDTQVSMLNSPEMCRDSSVGSEFVRGELEELRRAEASLEEELTQMQALFVFWFI
ncbi:keratin, type I cytoskeletal 14-like isoform X2 [Channa argus]|uniref:keratin, type I cytoskeletal 14-like isoform X2 n=1 Tax=Channa argus TaxID=215402 RepID=UPI00352185E6